MTQAGAAAALRISLIEYRRYERGARKMPEAISEAFIAIFGDVAEYRQVTEAESLVHPVFPHLTMPHKDVIARLNILFDAEGNPQKRYRKFINRGKCYDLPGKQHAIGSMDRYVRLLCACAGDLTVTEFAAHAGISETTVRDIERNRKPYSPTIQDGRQRCHKIIKHYRDTGIVPTLEPTDTHKNYSERYAKREGVTPREPETVETIIHAAPGATANFAIEHGWAIYVAYAALAGVLTAGVWAVTQ